MMKNIPLMAVCCLFLSPCSLPAQPTAPAYQLPAQFSFDYEVVQKSINKKNKLDTAEMHYFFTRSGDMAGARISERKGGYKFIVYTKDGANIIIDDQEKTIIITRMKRIMGDVAEATKGMKKQPAPAAKDTSDQPRMIKTGNTKLISGYKAEEYKITDNKGHEGHIWYAKVDFNTQLLYSFGLGAVGTSAVANSRAANNPFLHAFADPNTLMAEIDGGNSPDNTGLIYTQSIAKKITTLSVKGYQVHDYSNMGLKEMMQQGQQKKGG